MINIIQPSDKAKQLIKRMQIEKKLIRHFKNDIILYGVETLEKKVFDELKKAKLIVCRATSELYDFYDLPEKK